MDFFEFPKEYEFFNVKTGEKRTLTASGQYAKHMINGFILTSNLGRNASRGQDFGWRLGKPTLEAIKRAQSNPSVMREIAAAKGINPRSVRLPDLIEYMVDAHNNTVQAREIDEDETPRFQAEYEASIRGIGEYQVPDAETVAEQAPEEPVKEPTGDPLAKAKASTSKAPAKKS